MWIGQIPLPPAVGISAPTLAALGKRTVSQVVNRTTLTPTPAAGNAQGTLCGSSTKVSTLVLALGVQS